MTKAINSITDGGGLAAIMAGPGPHPFLAPPDAGGAGGAAGTDDGTAGGAAAGGGADPGAGGGNAAGNPPADPGGQTPPAAYYPEGLPEHLRGATERETIDKLFAEQTSLRETLSKNGAVPDDPAAYKFEFEGDPAKAIFDLEAETSQKAVGMFKEVAKEFGLTDKQFAAVPRFLEKAVEAGLIEAPQSTESILESMAPEGTRGSPDEIRAAGGARLTQALNTVDAAIANQKMPAEVGEQLKNMVSSAAGLNALEYLMQHNINDANQPGGQGGAAGVTAKDLQTRMADPRNDRNNNAYDADFAKQTIELYKQVHGGNPAG